MPRCSVPRRRRAVGLWGRGGRAAGVGAGREHADVAPHPTRPRTSPAPAEDAPDATQLRITFGDTELTARLDDNATARDLAAQLPLTLTFRDHNGVERTAPLPTVLSTEGAPYAHDPVAGDLGYFAPGGDLVLYHDDEAPEFPGIVRIGRLDGDVEALTRQTDEFEATVDAAE